MDRTADNLQLFADDGCPAVISQAGLPDRPAVVLYDPMPLDSMGTQTDKPQIIIADADLVGLDLREATIIVTGRHPAARITKPQADGSGLTTALLTRI